MKIENVYATTFATSKQHLDMRKYRVARKTADMNRYELYEYADIGIGFSKNLSEKQTTPF